MKKYLSLLLVTSVLITSTTNCIIAKPMMRNSIQFQEHNKALEESEKGLVFGNLEEDENTFTWDISEGGKYELSYYVEHLNKTKKVTLTFDVGTRETQIIDFKADMYYKDDITSSKIMFVEKLYPFDKWSTPVLDVFKKEFLIGTGNTSIPAANQELSLKIDNFLNLKVLLKENSILVTTDGINKGLITDVNLIHENIESSQLKIFKGPKDLKATPTYLYDDGLELKSKDFINGNQEVAGLKPGIEVSFERPKYIKNEEFVYITEDEAKNINAVTSIWPEFEEGQSNEQQRIRLDFSLENGSVVTGDLVTSPKKIKVENEKVKLYISQDDTFTSNNKEYVVGWPNLKESMILGGVVELSGGILNGLKNNTHYLSPKGFTYLKYFAYKKNDKEISLDIIPYKISSEVTYKVYNRYSSSSAWNEVISYKHNGKDFSNSLKLSFLGATKQQYLIEAFIEGDKSPFKSQILEYNPINDSAILSMPQIVDVFNAYVTPSEKANLQPSSIGFDLAFQSPSDINTLLDKGDLYYELMLHNQSKSTSYPIKVFKVNKKDNEINLNVFAGTVSAQTGVNYNSSNNTFTVKNIHLKNFLEKGWERLIINSNDLIGAKDYLSNISIANDIDFSIPNQYYLSLRTVFDPLDANKSISISPESNLKALTLSETKEVLPTINILTGQINADNSHSVFFNGTNIKSYVDKMLSPILWNLWDRGNQQNSFYQGTYELILSTDKDVSEADISINPNDVGTIEIDQQTQELLREGKAIKIEIPKMSMEDNLSELKVTFLNLDPNEVYYLRGRIKLDAWRDLNGKTENKKIYSNYSNIFSFTTQSKPIPPTLEDKMPSAPNSIFTIEEAKNGQVLLGWEPTNISKEDGLDNVYYEILRLEDTQLETQNKKDKIEDLVKKDTGRKAFRTQNIYIEKMDKNSSYIWENQEGNQLSQDLQLRDYDLKPNTIYYYYIRTIGVVGENTVASKWISIPITTSPIDEPIELKIEKASNYTYDEKHQVAISFLAPIDSINNVPDKYDFEIALKKDDGEYETISTAKKITAKESSLVKGYIKVVYKIEDLKSSSRYDVKVRMLDKTKSSPYPTSLYSNKASFRTNYDEIEAEIENKLEELLKYYDNEVKKIKNKSCWNGIYKNTPIFKYKEDYLTSLIRENNPIDLASNLENTSAYYYLPLSNVLTDGFPSLNLTINKINLSFRKNIVHNQLKEIKDIVLEKEKGKIDDLYLGIYIETSSAKQLIDQSSAISPKLKLSFNIISTSKEDTEIEQNLLNRLDAIIEKEKKSLEKAIEKELSRNNQIDEDKLKMISDKSIENVLENISEVFAKSFNAYIDKTYPINKIGSSVLISYPTNSYLSNGYYFDGSWKNQLSYPILGAIAMEGFYSGEYMFISKETSNSLVNQIPNAYNIVSKYRLQDFMKLDSSSNQLILKNNLYGIAARLLGAPSNANTINYLKANGIRGINNISTYSPLKMEDAIFVLMQVYEKNLSKSIQSIMINNKQKISNLGEYQTEVQKYVLAAVELGVVNPVGGRVNPKTVVNEMEVLKMISKIMPK